MGGRPCLITLCPICELFGDEEAEEWDKTRCAKRVSLVRLPSTFNLSSRFERLQEGESIREQARASPG